MSFEDLLAEINGLKESQEETMRKALPADDGTDENIQAAAEDGGASDQGPELDEDGNPIAKPEGDEPELLGKSLGIVTMPDGTEQEAIDGTELVKSLKAQVEGLGQKQTESESQMLKAVQGFADLIKTQNEMMKSMQAELSALRQSGSGRKSALNVHEKVPAGTLAKSEQTPQLTTGEFMAKCHAAFDSNKITGLELTAIDVALRNNSPVDPSLIQKVLN